MTRFNKDKAREELRTIVKLSDVNKLDDLDPTKDYHFVNLELSGTGKTGMRWLDQFLDAGWEIEHTSSESIDERHESKSTPQRETIKPSPATKKTQFQGKVCVLMSIDKSKHIENYKKEMALNMANFKTQQRIVNRRGRHISIQGHEVDYHNPNNN